MKRVDQYFLTLSAACLIAGVALGIGMGIAHDFQFAPVHAHINLLGFVSLAVFGIVYRLYPELGASRLAALHLAVAAPSAVACPGGIYLSIAHEAPGVAIGASLLWFAGALLFFANLVWNFLLARSPDAVRAATELRQAA